MTKADARKPDRPLSVIPRHQLGYVKNMRNSFFVSNVEPPTITLQNARTQ